MANLPKLPALFRHPVAVLGGVITTSSAVVFAIFFFLELVGMEGGPYSGILAYMIVPAFFVAGLLLVPVGVALDRRRRALGVPGRLDEWPRIDLNVRRQRTVAFLVVVATLVNVVIVSVAAYKGVEYMDSTAFCGEVCHSVMDPEFTAYQDGPHSRVGCVRCHIGPGAPWFVKAKISGIRQVFAVNLNTYSRPIPSPVHDLRPARDTCEQCHWPEKFHGDIISEVREYASDEANSESTTVLRVHVGGVTPKAGVATGIHWHVDPANHVEYVAVDDRRQTIGRVTLRDRDGKVIREWIADGVTTEQLAGRETRQMDCVDCHNRPTHPFAANADRAVDRAIAREEISRALPYIKREAVAALKTSYPSQEAAMIAIADRLMTFYRTGHAEVARAQRDELARSVAAVGRLYRRNIFPSMKVTWGSYPNNIGHVDSPGCFRCHDEAHRTRDGRAIGQDCELCHTIE